MRGEDDALVRSAMRHEDWPLVGADTKDALAALYADADAGLGDDAFQDRIATIIESDDFLAALVVLCEQQTPDVERAVLSVSGRSPAPYRWSCPEPGCTVSVPGSHSRPAVEERCPRHPARALVRTP